MMKTLILTHYNHMLMKLKHDSYTKGRASYFKEDSKGYIDPGAQSSVYILNAMIEER